MPLLRYILFNRNQNYTELFLSKITALTNLTVSRDITDIKTADIIITPPDKNTIYKLSTCHPDIIFYILDITADKLRYIRDAKLKHVTQNVILQTITDPQSFADNAISLQHNLNAFARLHQIIKELNIAKPLDTHISDDIYVNIIMNNNDTLTGICRKWLSLQHNSFSTAPQYEFKFAVSCGVLAEAVDELNLRLSSSDITINEEDAFNVRIDNTGFTGDHIFEFKKIIYTHNLNDLITKLRQEHINYDFKRLL